MRCATVPLSGLRKANSIAVGLSCIGAISKRHSLVPNSVGHIAFGFVWRIGDDVLSLGVPFSSTRLVAIRTMRDAVNYSLANLPLFANSSLISTERFPCSIRIQRILFSFAP
jgi:hypothetical protein